MMMIACPGEVTATHREVGEVVVVVGGLAIVHQTIVLVAAVQTTTTTTAKVVCFSAPMLKMPVDVM